MTTYYQARRRAAAALSYTRPSNPIHRFSPESLLHSGDRVTGWRDEVSGLVLKANGNIRYTASDARLGGRASASISRTDYFDPFELQLTGPFTIGIVFRLTEQADPYYQVAPFVQRSTTGAFYGLSLGEYGRALNYNGAGYDLINNPLFDAFAPAAVVASMTNVQDIASLRLFRNATELLPLSEGVNVATLTSTCWIGYLNADTKFSLIGPVAEVVIYGQPLLSDEPENLAGSLTQDFGMDELNVF